MFPGPGGDPDPSTRATFAAGAASPVDLQIGPGGDLFYVGLKDGTIRRIRYFPANQPPVADIRVDVTSGPAPLTVHFDASHSSDPDAGDSLTFAWDLDGDGEYDDATAVAPTYTYTRAGNYSVGLRVTDSHQATGFATVTIAVGNVPPTATIAAPAPSLTWKVGDLIEFQGSATDPEDGSLPPSALSWVLILHHCPSGCHEHLVQGWPGVASGSFTAPDHEYPSYFELQLVATDSGGLTDTRSVLLYPATVPLTFQSSPTGAELAVGSGAGTAPFTRTVIVGSATTVGAASPQSVGALYKFRSWSDGGAQVHTIVAPETASTYTAVFGAACGDGVLDPGEACDDGNAVAGDGCSPGCECEVTCGDGVVTTPCEECDLGALNGQPGSGCGGDCRLRGRCSGSGGDCATAADCPEGEGCCGNGVLERDEECDDGNSQDLDCCSSRCKLEPAGSPGTCDDGATPCASAADCGGGLCHQNCEPQTCRAHGPHLTTTLVRKTLAGGALGKRWTTKGDYSLNAGQVLAPDAEEVELTLSEGGRVLYDTLLPAGSFTRRGADSCSRRWALSDRVMAAARGWSRAKFVQRRGPAAGCAPKLRFKLSGKNLFQTPLAAPRLRQTLRIGDDCATAIVLCRARGENQRLVCRSNGYLRERRVGLESPQGEERAERQGRTRPSPSHTPLPGG